MRVWLKWCVLLVSIALLLVLFAASIMSSTYEECAASYQQQTTDPEKGNPPSNPTRTLIDEVKVFLHCEGEILHGNSEAIIAIFTIVLSLSTILLWMATSEVVSSAERTSREQLSHDREINRAYLGGGGDCENVAGQRFFRFEVGNHGQTPAFLYAFDIHFDTLAAVQKRLKPVTPRYPHVDQFPPGERHRRIGSLVPIPRANDDIIYGAVWYRDIWHQPHYYRFILQISADGHAHASVAGVHDDYTKWT